MFPLPLVVTIGNSRRLRFFLAAAHVCCAIAIFLAALAPYLQWAIMLLLVFSLAYYWRPDRDVRLRCDRDGNLEIWRDEQWRAENLAGSSVILPGCAVLRIATENRWLPRNLVVLADSLPADDFRRLRVWLRWRGNRPEATGTTTEMPDQ
ncbi:MAG: protein YgfX [Pseudomonadota bacterium]|nr:protein YgfX [Pseudomonadota bacterium]